MLKCYHYVYNRASVYFSRWFVYIGIACTYPRWQFVPRLKPATTVLSHYLQWSLQNNLDNKCDPGQLCAFDWLGPCKEPQVRAFSNMHISRTFSSLVTFSQGILHFAFAIVVVACFSVLEYIVIWGMNRSYCHQSSGLVRKHSLAPWSRVSLLHIGLLSKYSSEHNYHSHVLASRYIATDVSDFLGIQVHRQN